METKSTALFDAESYKKLLSQDLGQCIQELLNYLPHNNPYFDELIQVQGRLVQVYKSERLGTTSNDDLNLELSKIRKSVIEIINQYSKYEENEIIQEDKPNIGSLVNRYKLPIAIGVIVLLALFFVIRYLQKDQRMAREIVVEFLESMQDNEITKAESYFSQINSYPYRCVPDSFVIEEVFRENERLVVELVGNCYTEEERKMVFYLDKGDTGQLSIRDTKNFLNLNYSQTQPKIELAISIGCLPHRDVTDLTLLEGIAKAKIYITQNKEAYLEELSKNLQILSWEWNKYAGTVYVEGVVLNNLPFDIHNLEIGVEFRNDDGVVVSKAKDRMYVLDQNSSDNFIFEVPYVGNASKARINLSYENINFIRFANEKNSFTGLECNSLGDE